jgi:hypothetical protein
MSEAAPTYAAVKAICARFVERANALNYKGKKGDSAALDYIVGAKVGAELAGNEALAKHLETIVWVVSIRGQLEVRHIAAGV